MKKIGFIIFLSALALGILVSSNCILNKSGDSTFAQSGSGTKATEQRNLADFSEIKASSAVKGEISVQENFSVVVEADDNLIKNVITEVRGDVLNISIKDNTKSQTPVTIRVGMPQLTNLEVNGASQATVSGVKGDSISLKANGASNIKIKGEVKTLDADAGGASEINAEELKTEKTNVEASGASRATVYAIIELTANASGASTIVYLGEPATLNQDSSGASSIKKK